MKQCALAAEENLIKINIISKTNYSFFKVIESFTTQSVGFKNENITFKFITNSYWISLFHNYSGQATVQR